MRVDFDSMTENFGFTFHPSSVIEVVFENNSLSIKELEKWFKSIGNRNAKCEWISRENEREETRV